MNIAYSLSFFFLPLSIRLNTNTAIHHALQKVLGEGDVVEMDAVDRRVAELFMFDFEQSGIHLEHKKVG
jgi:intermediate peptidase